MLILLGALLLVTSCSTAPKRTTGSDEVKNRAAQYSRTGNVYFSRGQYDQALRLFRLSLQENLSVDNRSGAVAAYNSIGQTFMAAGDMADAKNAFDRAIGLATAIQDGNLILRSKTNLAELMLEQDSSDIATGTTEKAVKILEALLAGATEKSDRGDLAIVHHDLGAAYARLSQYSLAEIHLHQALSMNEALKRPVEIASDYYMLASLFSRQGLMEKASTAIASALEFDKQAENSPGIASDLYAAGQISAKSGDTPSAYDYYGRALQVYIALNSKAGVRSTLDRLIPLAESAGKADDLKGFKSMLKNLDRTGTE
jgi:tetratricopeptide (TPR) repeat protein